MSTTTIRATARWPLTALRVAISLHAAAVLVQAITIGQAMGALHASGAGVVHLAGLLQVIAAVLYWRPGRGAGWPIWISTLLLLAGFAQSMTGGGAPAVHFPLGVTLFGGTIALLTWAWRPAKTRPSHGGY